MINLAMHIVTIVGLDLNLKKLNAMNATENIWDGKSAVKNVISWRRKFWKSRGDAYDCVKITAKNN